MKQLTNPNNVQISGFLFKNKIILKNLMRRRNLLVALTTIILLTTQPIFSQTINYFYGFNYLFKTMMINGVKTDCFVVTSTIADFPVNKAGIHEGDVIIAIDGQPINEKSFDSTGSKATMTLSVKRFGNQDITFNIPGIPCFSNDRIAESTYAWMDITGYSSAYVTEKTLSIEPINIMSDPDIDFFRYATFDFEFIGQNIMQQKEISPNIEDFLTKRGLKRDRQNPDILVFIDFFSDRREQYVPPSQALTTRYGTQYNVWTRQWETRQYVESYQNGNYTKVDFLSKLSIAIADAQKLSKGELETAKIWQADYEVLSQTRADLKNFSHFIGYEMLSFFPFNIQRITANTFWCTGIIYNSKIEGKVDGIVPDSPADQAGIKAGDIIKDCSWGENTIFRKSYDNLCEIHVKNPASNDVHHFNFQDFELTRCSNTIYGDNSYIPPFQSTYMNYYRKELKNGIKYVENTHGSKPLIFQVKSRDGKTRNIQVSPLKATEYLLNF
ncbi:MAG: PDZ domain-containing protein [Candidatus Azobacteroides sp.]|nr:PDZ domain-containing protein [Candidatus Azobacteroides sp.]